MLATGANLSLTMSCKMVGLFTFMSVGSAVAIDLWNIMDIRRGFPMVSFSHSSSCSCRLTRQIPSFHRDTS
jgi:dolichyl-phosphate-mannose--protein O-mannosyl transferase